MNVIVTQTEAIPVDLATFAEGLLEASITTYALPRLAERYDEDAIVAALAGADAIFLRVGDLTASVLQRLPQLKVVVLHGTGLDQVDVAAAQALGIAVGNTPGGNTQSVVELTIGLMLSVLRHVPQCDRALRAGVDWDKSRVVGRELSGKTVGIIGYGRTGQGVAAVCAAFGAQVLVHRRAQPCLETLLAQSDLVTLHVPLTDDTRNLLNQERLARMKPGAILINVARGGVVDLDALAALLARGHLGGAGLDVFPVEPPDRTHPIFHLPNVVLTPHLGGSTQECLTRIARLGAEEIRRLLWK